MVARLVVLLIICMARKIWWCLEQPKGSLLSGHVLFQRMLQLQHVAVTRVTCCLGHFGADSMKPIWVYSSSWSSLLSSCLFKFLDSYQVSFVNVLKKNKGSREIWQCFSVESLQGEPEADEFNDHADRSLRPHNPNMVRHYTDGNGQARITGGSELKASQAYPVRTFGQKSQFIFCVPPNNLGISLLFHQIEGGVIQVIYVEKTPTNVEIFGL